MSLKEKIKAETKLIKELEISYPKLNEEVHLHDKLNLEWHIHDTKVREAYWRRRHLMSGTYTESSML